MTPGFFWQRQNYGGRFVPFNTSHGCNFGRDRALAVCCCRVIFERSAALGFRFSRKPLRCTTKDFTAQNAAKCAMCRSVRLSVGPSVTIIPLQESIIKAKILEATSSKYPSSGRSSAGGCAARCSAPSATRLSRLVRYSSCLIRRRFVIVR